MQNYTFLWHDYESFGLNPRSARPAQFAAIRTDAELNETGEVLNIFCRPSPDFLPEPQSCLITGITPQQCLAEGVSEREFAQQIEAALGATATIGLGYNTLRYDDELTRHLFWRNLIDPYAREWQNNCGRWDILDLVRTTYALRPEGIQWPLNDEGKPSFRLEHLSAANGVTHQAAHDALSDVRATIALARLIREKQPRLFDYCLGLRSKERVLEELSLAAPRPVIHISGQYKTEQGCLSLIWPLAIHPTNKNEVICWDLRQDPQRLLSLDAEAIKARLFVKQADLPEGEQRLGLKTLHINRSPIVISQLKTLSPTLAAKYEVDFEVIEKHAQLLRQAPDMSKIWRQVFERQAYAELDVDEDLYGGFLSQHDRRQLNEFRFMTGPELARSRPHFDDARLGELFFRYRARNFYETLSSDEQLQWRNHCRARLLDGAGGALTVSQLSEQIDQLALEFENQENESSERALEILNDLYDYSDQVMEWVSQ